MTLPQDIEKLQSEMSAAVREHWKAFLIEGIILVVLGLAAIILPPLASLAVTILLGWILLAVGAYLSRTLGLIQSAALGLMSALMMGVLKGSSIVSVISTSGLCLAFVPLGFRLLCTPETPPLRTLICGAGMGLALVAALFYFGQLG